MCTYMGVVYLGFSAFLFKRKTVVLKNYRPCIDFITGFGKRLVFFIKKK